DPGLQDVFELAHLVLEHGTEAVGRSAVVVRVDEIDRELRDATRVAGTKVVLQRHGASGAGDSRIPEMGMDPARTASQFPARVGNVEVTRLVRDPLASITDRPCPDRGAEGAGRRTGRNGDERDEGNPEASPLRHE